MFKFKSGDLIIFDKDEKANRLILGTTGDSYYKVYYISSRIINYSSKEYLERAYEKAG